MILEDLFRMGATHALLQLLTAVGEEGSTSQNGTLIIDLLNMQWWQALFGIIAALGLSPAPWILGLATNRIQFTAAANAAYEKREQVMRENHAREMAALESYHEKVLLAKDQRYSDLEEVHDRNVVALGSQTERADKATNAVYGVTGALKQTAHVIDELRQAAQEVSPDGT